MWENYKSQIQKQKKIDENCFIIGIDLGTTHSVVSYFSLSTMRPEPIDISNGFGKIPMPTVVQYRKEEGFEEWIVGEEALRSYPLYPETTILSIKRKMGSNEKTKIGDRDYLPEEISAMILRELIGHVQSLNPKFELAGVVVSVPYDFDDAAKKATIKACQLAGFSESLICLIEEPKAAALAYSFNHAISKDEKIMVFDFGGGTLDITIFHVTEANSEEVCLQVISEGGEAYHGGDHIDEQLLQRLYKMIEEKTGCKKESITKENQAELTLKARELKERLTGVKKFRIPFTFLVPPFMQEMTRDQMEDEIQGFIQKTRQLVLKTLSEGYQGPIHPEDIHRVLLEGGSSAMPWVREMLISIFNDVEKIYGSDKPALDISIGATYYAAMKLGLLEHPELMDFRKSIQFDVTVPHDIGFEIEIGNKKEFFTMIGRGTPYTLANKFHVFTLTGENEKDMTTLEFKILERMHKGDKVKDCHVIGEVFIEGLPQRPSGKTKLKLSLRVDEEGGMVHGSVEDLGYMDTFAPSSFKKVFSPNRSHKTIVKYEEMER